MYSRNHLMAKSAALFFFLSSWIGRPSSRRIFFRLSWSEVGNYEFRPLGKCNIKQGEACHACMPRGGVWYHLTWSRCLYFMWDFLSVLAEAALFIFYLVCLSCVHLRDLLQHSLVPQTHNDPVRLVSKSNCKMFRAFLHSDVKGPLVEMW